MGSSCSPTYPTTGSTDQGVQFAKMTAAYHGGSRKSLRRNKKMRTTRRMRGGAYFTPYSDYPTAFNQMLPSNMTGPMSPLESGVPGGSATGSLDAKFAELPAIIRAAQGGGSRRRSSRRRGGSRRRSTRRHRGGCGAPVNASYTLLSSTNAARAGVVPTGGRRRFRGGSAPVNAPAVILSSPEELAAARLNPQWYTENTVIPNFRGNVPYPGGTVSAPMPPLPPSGGRRGRKARYSRRR